MTIADVVTLLAANRNTVKLHRANWFNRGIWSSMGSVRGRGIPWGA